VKVAFVTTPPSLRSGIGDYARHLLPYLRELCDVEVFVRHGHDEPGWGEHRAARAEDLDPRRYDQVLFQLGNELNHGFMGRMVRAIGGTVMQHDWILFDLAAGAWPGLARGGLKGHALALREGGPDQLKTYTRNWLDRRRQRLEAAPATDPSGLTGTLLSGWHFPEEGGRWTADLASLRIPGEGVRRVRIELHVDPGRAVRLLCEGEVLGQIRDGMIDVALAASDRPLLFLDTKGIVVTRSQRDHGDARRLGCKVLHVTWWDRAGEHELDLGEAAAAPVVPISLSRDRFLLPLNRSVVRFADSFIVHSQHVKQLILRERNARTAIGIVHHGSENRVKDEDRRETRKGLGLPPDWCEGFLVASFGGIQPHKRLDKALRGFALAREKRPDLRFVIAGSVDSQVFDPVAHARRLGVVDAVHCPGYVSEEDAWRWLHAADVAVNLRGPSTGGTSGGIFQAFSLGRSVIASDAAEQKELPDSCVVKTPLGEGEVEGLCAALVELRDDPARRDRLEAAVRDFVRDECHWSVVARRYVEHLESFPRPRFTRRKIVAMKTSLARLRE